MPCTKTGAHIFIEPYNEYAYGDAYEVEAILKQDEELWRELYYNGWADKIHNTAYFRLVKRSFTPINNFDVIHYTIHNYDNWFDNRDVEETLNNSLLITNDFTNHGHDGRKFNDA